MRQIGFIFDELGPLMEEYGNSNIVISPRWELLVVKNVPMPNGCSIRKATVLFDIPDGYGSSVSIMPSFILLEERREQIPLPDCTGEIERKIERAFGMLLPAVHRATDACRWYNASPLVAKDEIRKKNPLPQRGETLPEFGFIAHLHLVCDIMKAAFVEDTFERADEVAMFVSDKMRASYQERIREYVVRSVWSKVRFAH